MKNLIIIFGLFSFLANAKANIEPISKQYVYAFAGLKMRIAPGLNQEVLKVIPYGSKVELLAKSEVAERIEWMTGSWVKVRHEETEGFIFEGFISELPLPEYHFEMTQNDLDLTYPILAWAEFNFDEIKKADTLDKIEIYKVTQFFENGATITRRDTKYNFEVTLKLKEHNISEAYNLLKSMLLTKAEREVFVDKSLFIKDKTGEIAKIKITLDNPVEIKTEHDGSIKIKVTSFHHGCDTF